MVCGDKRLTYRELNDRSDRLSAALVRLGIQGGDRVAFLSFNCHRLLEAYYGVPQIGAILLPLNIRLSPEELAYILGDSTPQVLIFDPEFTPLVEDLRSRTQTVRTYITMHGSKPSWANNESLDELLAASARADFDWTSIDEDSVAELFYTSGTTAYPKGVMLTHRNLYLHALYTALGMHASDRDVHLYAVPLFHANSWGAPHVFALCGGRHVLPRKFSPPEVLPMIQQERVTSIHMVPTMAIALLNHPEFSRYDLSSLKNVIIGGGPASTALFQEVKTKIPSCTPSGSYGLTETSPVLAIAHIKAHLAADAGEENLRRQSSAGYVLAGSEIRVIDANGKDVAPDNQQVGEVLVRGDVVMEGYWQQPEATAAAIRDGWLHTGDLATIDEEGYILIVDRAKDMILTGGENVASAEIERVLYQHPAVLECAVIAIPDDQWGEVPKAFITLKPGHEASHDEMVEHCRRHLARFKIPKVIEFSDALPKGGTGKILKKVLRGKSWAGYDRQVH